MRILICGDRNWNKKDETEKLLRYVLKPGDVVIHGAARGADQMAARIAKSMGLKVVPYPADWTKYRRGAGPIRNSEMLTKGKPEMVLALHADLENSKGTKDMTQKAMAAGVDTFLFDGEVVRMLQAQAVWIGATKT